MEAGIQVTELEDTDIRGEQPESALVPTAGTSRADVWFQVGAYGKEVNAVITRDRLSEAGFSTVSIKSSEGVNGVTLHRVRLGPFTEEDAGSARSRLEQAGYSVYRVVQ